MPTVDMITVYLRDGKKIPIEIENPDYLWDAIYEASRARDVDYFSIGKIENNPIVKWYQSDIFFELASGVIGLLAMIGLVMMAYGIWRMI